MAAAEYYMHGAAGNANAHNDPVSPIHPASPHPPSYHTNAPYEANPYDANRYSTQSVDTAYNPARPDSFSSLNQGPVKGSDPYGENPYADNIPLHRTNTNSRPITAAEAGRAGRRVPRKGANAIFAGGTRRPWFIWFISVVQIAVFIGELARNAVLTKTPIAIKPYFNPMIGPSTYTMIDMGARYVPCMRTIKGYNDDPDWDLFQCPNTTSADMSYQIVDGKLEANGSCSLAQMCGFSGQNIPKKMGGSASDDSQPNQWWRFIVPMFLHAGLIHIAFNLFAQVTLGSEMERKIGPLRLSFVYFASGIFGFVLGANLGALGQPSVGASGCLFGIFALTLLDLLYEWELRPSPGRDLLWLILDMVISFVIGLLPGVDNFAHIGGFACGLALGLVVLHSPNKLRQRVGIASDPPYTAAKPTNPYNNSTGDNQLEGTTGFLKQPVGFFKGRSGLWWAWWIVRAAALTGVLVALIVMINNFYKYKKSCSWCRYLSCLPVLNWCSLYDLSTQPNATSVNNATSRMMLARALGMAEGLLGEI